MPNRTICSIFDEMRTCLKTLNFAYLPSLIEEAQSAANRMEAALWDQSDLEYARKELSKLKKRVKQLKEKVGEEE